jgi:transcriptional antiterminator NusG
MPSQWYAVHTLAGHEQKVSRIIKQVAQSQGLWNTDIFEILIPTEEVLVTRDGKRTTSERKVFPGYILIRMNLTEDTERLVRRTPGVTGFVSSGRKPVPIDDKDVQGILNRIGESRKAPRVPWQKGDTVRVTEGPFTDFPGKVEEVLADKQKLKVLLTIFGRETPVELDFSQVEKV